jgi:hypothetical protein
MNLRKYAKEIKESSEIVQRVYKIPKNNMKEIRDSLSCMYSVGFSDAIDEMRKKMNIIMTEPSYEARLRRRPNGMAK